MRKPLLFIVLCLQVAVIKGYAQTNYVATTPSSATPGSDNTLVGIGAGNLNMSGASNLMIGRGAGILNMAGTKNVFIGAAAGGQNSSGLSNAFIGFSAGYSNTNGNNNTFSGSEAGYSNSTGFNNAFLGNRSGYFNTTGSNNAFLGTGAGYANTIGTDNTFVGSDAGASNTTGKENVFIGSLAGTNNSDGLGNTFVGIRTGQNNSTGSYNVNMGYTSGFSNTSGFNNVFIGQRTGYSNSTGTCNLFIGSYSGYANTVGGYNTFIGNSTGQNNTTGFNNVFLGNGAGLNNTIGEQNTFIGLEAGKANINGTKNVFIGTRAGLNSVVGHSNVFIGDGAGASALNASTDPNLVNATAIGTNAIVRKNNSVVIGDTINARVGFGTGSPNNRVEIRALTTNSSGLRFSNLTSSSSATVLNQTKFLTVNGEGDVVLGSINGSGRIGADETGSWFLQGENIQNTNLGGVIIGQGVDKTPIGYRLYVAEGILTEKVKVAIKSTIDWSDRVFERDYQLRKLSELETFIAHKKHLPGIPSAEQVVEEGIDIGQMQAKLLEKVEELTLYIINLEKIKTKQQVEINELKKLVNQFLQKNRTTSGNLCQRCKANSNGSTTKAK